MQILSYYQLKKSDYLFLVFMDEYIEKYPFKCYNIMDSLLKKDIVFIRQTTMIIDLIKLNDDEVVNIFDFFKNMLRNNLIKKIIYKKEVLFIYFNSEFIIDFFLIKDKWLIIPLIIEFIKLDYNFYFDAYVNHENITKLMFLVIINNKYVSIDVKDTIKLTNNHYPLTISFYNNNHNNLKFSFDKVEILNNFNNKLIS